MHMIARYRSLPHGQVPNFLYGTAWKEDATAALVTQAITAGFRGIDTANQRKHYHEAGVGQAVQAALTSGQVRRAELFLQSKFTFRDGQDHRLPYDPNAAVAKQVTQSFASSCEHLGVEYLDSLVLHGPSQSGTLGAADHEAWRAMEQLVLAGSVGVIGISNVAATQLRELLQFARVAPTFVQNRCYASRGWDAAIRTICVVNGQPLRACITSRAGMRTKTRSQPRANRFSLCLANRHVAAHRVQRHVALARRFGLF
jgi:diketogulonate reductase-like aldo/keto reductase